MAESNEGKDRYRLVETEWMVSEYVRHWTIASSDEEAIARSAIVSDAGRFDFFCHQSQGDQMTKCAYRVVETTKKRPDDDVKWDTLPQISISADDLERRVQTETLGEAVDGVLRDIQAFHDVCREEGQTDTGCAWELFDTIIKRLKGAR